MLESSGIRYHIRVQHKGACSSGCSTIPLRLDLRKGEPRAGGNVRITTTGSYLAFSQMPG